MLILGQTVYPLLGLTLVVLTISATIWVVRPQVRQSQALPRLVKAAGYALGVELVLAAIYMVWLITSDWPDMRNF